MERKKPRRSKHVHDGHRSVEEIISTVWIPRPSLERIPKSKVSNKAAMPSKTKPVEINNLCKSNPALTTAEASRSESDKDEEIFEIPEAEGVAYQIQVYDRETRQAKIISKFAKFLDSHKDCISFAGEQLIRLPLKALSAFPRLSSLDLSYNQLTFIPPALVTGLPALKRLWIGHNAITTFPKNFVAWKDTLESLFAEHNKIKALPDMSEFNKLVQLNLEENPLSSNWLLIFDGIKWSGDGINRAADCARLSCKTLQFLEKYLPGVTRGVITANDGIVHSEIAVGNSSSFQFYELKKL